MKFPHLFTSRSTILPPSGQKARSVTSIHPRFRLLGCGLAAATLTVAIAQPGLTSLESAAELAAPAIAQALPTPLPPLPANSGVSATTGEQYLVLISGSSDQLLQQVRQVEPGAFVNYVDGRSVIQAGRFSSYQNAQVRADELANFGIGAEVQTSNFTGAPIAVTSPTGYDLSYPTAVPTSVPVNSVAATPSSIEFGQAAPFQTAPASSAAFPPPFPITAPTNTTAPPLTAPTIVNESLPSGYYVVVPASMTELQGIARQVVALGAPSSIVSTRTAPRGPHVAVGPYDDHGIAQEWSGYLRDSGFASARVHFE